MGRIVVGVDGSEPSKAALGWALEEARRRSAALEVVTAYPLPAAVAGMGEALGATVASPIGETDVAAYAAAALHDVLAEVDHRDVEVAPSVVRGHPAQVLETAAADADLLVVGAGRRDAGLHLGSVVTHCVRHAACPVVVVRVPRRERRVPGEWPPKPGGTWVIDLDGVVWLTGEPIAGAAGAVATLRRSGVRALFCTNNSSMTVAELCRRLARVGIDAAPADVVTSAQAAAAMVAPGSTALILAGDGVREALAERGVRVVEDGPADTVMVGWTPAFDFDGLARAATSVRAGARLIGTNEDATYPTPDGLVPGGGSLLAAVATASGVRPEVAGKPHRPLVDLVSARADDVVAVVGDRPSTDGLLARELGVPYVLVLSGVTSEAGRAAAAFTATDLGALVETLGR